MFGQTDRISAREDAYLASQTQRPGKHAIQKVDAEESLEDKLDRTQVLLASAIAEIIFIRRNLKDYQKSDQNG